MKRLVLILEGAADDPIPELDGRTPLQAAIKVTLDRLGNIGRLGTTVFLPHDWPARAESSLLSCLGYDPARFAAGRAAVEAAALEIPLGPRDQLLRCDLVCVEDGVLRDPSPRNFAPAELSALLASIQACSPKLDLSLHHAAQHRTLLQIRNAEAPAGPFTPPYDAIDLPMQRHLPRGKYAGLLTAWMRRAADALGGLELNGLRAELGESPADAIWFWGEGPRPKLPRFREHLGEGAAIVPDSLLMHGLGRVARLEIFNPAGRAGNSLPNELSAIGAAAMSALENWDVVFVHAAGCDRAGHGGRPADKLLTIEHTDRVLVAALVDRLQQEREWRMLVLTAHATLLAKRQHDNRPTPFVIAGTGLDTNRGESFDESHAATGELRFDRGCDVIEYFLRI